MSDEPTGGGLHIDGYWKEEAAREKERLLDEEKKRQDSPAEGTPKGGSFVDLVNMIAMQAAIGLGGYSEPGGEKIPPNLQLAKHHIDLLDALENKTKGNLDTEEKRTLDAVIYELRMQYVQRTGSQSPPGAGGARA